MKDIKIIKPFYISFEVGDVLTKTDNGYAIHVTNDEYQGDITLADEYVDYLKNFNVVEEEKNFVNIFDEIDTLINRYTDELDNSDNKNLAPTVRLEKETVLTNIIKVLNHLKNLKK